MMEWERARKTFRAEEERRQNGKRKGGKGQDRFREGYHSDLLLNLRTGKRPFPHSLPVPLESCDLIGGDNENNKENSGFAKEDSLPLKFALSQLTRHSDLLYCGD